MTRLTPLLPPQKAARARESAGLGPVVERVLARLADQWHRDAMLVLCRACANPDGFARRVEQAVDDTEGATWLDAGWAAFDYSINGAAPAVRLFRGDLRFAVRDRRDLEADGRWRSLLAPREP